MTAEQKRVFAASGGRFIASKYGLPPDQAMALVEHSECNEILSQHEKWREANGLPAASSALSRGKLLSIICSTKARGHE